MIWTRMIQASQAVIASGEILYIAPDVAAGLPEPGALLPLQIRGQIFRRFGDHRPRGEYIHPGAIGPLQINC